KARGLNGRQIGKLTQVLIGLLKPTDIPENIPDKIRLQLKLIGRYEAYCAIHFPTSEALHKKALERLKFEEFFIAQIRL
ncbi:hypothetical protein, partial [Staphylococcus aureus]